MKRPSPVPVVDFMANFVDSLGNISESMPGPVSVILTTISLVFGTLLAIALAMVLIFSGFLLRSFGKGKEEGFGNE
ncbi:MAG: hypothetical protein WBZ36_23140 [Candidatus Nitrosopolaris sp.]